MTPHLSRDRWHDWVPFISSFMWRWHRDPACPHTAGATSSGLWSVFRLHLKGCRELEAGLHFQLLLFMLSKSLPLRLGHVTHNSKISEGYGTILVSTQFLFIKLLFVPSLTPSAESHRVLEWWLVSTGQHLGSPGQSLIRGII